MNRIVRSLLNYFFKGVLVVLPLGTAIYLTWWAISTLDGSLNFTSRTGISTGNEVIYIPGLGILTVLLVILLAGIIVTNFITDPIKVWLGRWLKRLPLFNFLYSSIKDLTEAFVGDEKKFNEPVIVAFNDTGIKRIGFLTQKDLSTLNLPGDVAVYFPWSYSFAGQLAIVPRDNVKPLNMSGTEAMKFVVSGGVTHFR